MKNLRGIFVVGEKHIFDELAEIVAIAAEANNIVRRMFKLGNNAEALAENMHAVRSLEKKSDEVAFRIAEDITGGAVSPNILDNLIECGHVADTIVDTLYYLSRELHRMSKSNADEFPLHKETEWISIFEGLFALADKSMAKLKQALCSTSVGEILELRKDIEALEEEGDDIKDAGFDKLYTLSPGLHYLQFYHYSEMLHKADDVLDLCEDFSDLIVAVVTSVLK